MNQDHYLIVDAAPSVPDLDRLLADLGREFGLDAYTARQRLLGRGLALLARGERHKLVGMADLLAGAGVRHWLFRPERPRFVPDRLTALQVEQQTITFVGRKGRVTIPRGARVAACLADLSGRAVEKSLRRLVVQNAYRGSEAVEPIGDAGFRQAVLRGRPLLDIYLLDDEQLVAGAIRVVPGRFDPAGLGERKSYSAAGNLAAIVELLEAYAGRLELRTDFGLANIPGCRLRREEDPAAERENLISLTRFGWLTAQLALTPPAHAESSIGTAEPAAKDPGAPLAARPDLAAAAVAATAGAAAEIIPAAEKKAPAGEKTAAGRALPPPPAPESSGLVDRGRLLARLGGLGGILLGTGLALFQVGPGPRRALWEYGVRNGLLPGLLAVGLFWGGLYCLRLKRRIENTPTSKIRSLALGMVELQGCARRNYALVAPMTHLPCVWYRVRRYRRDRRNNWRLTSVTESGPVPFSLEDATGRVLVDPRGASVRARTREEGRPGALGLFSTGDTGDDQKWIEEVIPEGTPLYVLGFAASRRARRPTLRERTIAGLRRLKADREALAAYDRDGDGRIDAGEWQAARADMETAALHESLAERRRGSLESVVVGRPRQRGLPFVVAATESERKLTRNYGLLTVPLFVGAALAAAWTAALVVRYFYPGF
jgi:hypothetical protein